ncbi:MAG: hypothetical protein ACLQMU_11915 [Methanoregula sp.]
MSEDEISIKVKRKHVEDTPKKPEDITFIGYQTGIPKRSAKVTKRLKKP